jgi:hypothetical protein
MNLLANRKGVDQGYWDKEQTSYDDLLDAFPAFPDYEMFEIGIECAATLTKLDDSGT